MYHMAELDPDWGGFHALWSEADVAFRTDLSYATEMAKDGRPAEPRVEDPLPVGV